MAFVQPSRGQAPGFSTQASRPTATRSPSNDHATVSSAISFPAKLETTSKRCSWRSAYTSDDSCGWKDRHSRRPCRQQYGFGRGGDRMESVVGHDLKGDLGRRQLLRPDDNGFAFLPYGERPPHAPVVIRPAQPDLLFHFSAQDIRALNASEPVKLVIAAM